jgi:hypothetical protein
MRRSAVRTVRHARGAIRHAHLSLLARGLAAACLCVSALPLYAQTLATKTVVSWVSTRGPELHVFLTNKGARELSFFVGYGARFGPMATQCTPHVPWSTTDYVPGDHVPHDTLVRDSTGTLAPGGTTHRVLAYGFPPLEPPAKCTFRIVVENLSEQTQQLIELEVSRSGIVDGAASTSIDEKALPTARFDTVVEEVSGSERVARVLVSSNRTAPFEVVADYGSIDCPRGTTAWWSVRLGPIEGIASGPFTVSAEQPAAFARGIEGRGPRLQDCQALVRLSGINAAGALVDLKIVRFTLAAVGSFATFVE